ncbi:MAG: hypothetical protein ABIH23_27125 [bacterium]
MKQLTTAVLLLLVTASGISAKTLTYNQLDVVNMRDHGISTDERCTNVLVAVDRSVYGATSGDKCHVFRFDPGIGHIKVLATIEGPNTIMRGMVVNGDAVYVGTMLSDQQLWLKARENGESYEFEDVHLIPIRDSFNTGHLYKISGIQSDNPNIEDLGTPVPGQGIQTMAIDGERGIIYGVTSPNGRFFIFDTKTNTAEHTAFGHTYTNVSNHMVSVVEVEKELADLIPGEGEWNNRLIPKAMHVMPDGTLYTSGWRGQILKYDPKVKALAERFTPVGYIPSVPGRQHWNRIDTIIAHGEKLYMGTSDGYIIWLDTETGEMENLGKPIRAIEVMGMAFSTIDGKLYGVSGGGLEGMSRFWCCDVETGIFDVDYPAVEVIPNRHRVGDLVCTSDGTLVMSEAIRTGELRVLTPGAEKEWEKSGVLEEIDPQEGRSKEDSVDRHAGHKKLEVDVYPIPSDLHGGSGYTAIQADRDGKIYVGTAYYGKNAQLVQLDPQTAKWCCLFRSDELTHQYGRGQGVPGKIHTKLRLGADGKIYGAMKQGYELHYGIRSDVGEAPEGHRGSQYSCHFFSYDPATDAATDLGPGWPQEGITSFDVDTDRGYLYGATVPGVFFLVYDLKTNRVWNAGSIAYGHPTRYMPLDPGTGKVYHPGESTPAGRHFMTVWHPDEFRLRDIEIVPDEGFVYRHSYATCCGPAGTNTLYGQSSDHLFEMDLDDSKDGKLHVRPVCPIGVDGEIKPSMMYAIERGPDGRIYWASLGGRNVPIALFAWDPKTETKTYLGSCALGGEWFGWGHCQGICLDKDGNLALHILYCQVSEKQKGLWKVSDDFYYEDIEEQPHYLGYPAHEKGTYYAVYYLKHATAIK